MSENVCDLCGSKFTEEEIKIGKMLEDGDPCYCRNVKMVAKLKKQIKNLKTEVNNLNLLLSDAMESEWDSEEIYRNFRDGNGFSYSSNNPNKKMADWVAKRYKLNKKELDNE